MSNKNSETILRAVKCTGCGKLYFPPRYHCNVCGKDDFSVANLEGNGEVYSFTVIRVPFEEFSKEAPFAFAEVKIDEGLVVPGRFVNEEVEGIKIGSRVRFTKYDRGVNWFELT